MHLNWYAIAAFPVAVNVHFKKFVNEKICFEIETFSTLSLIVLNKGSFLALQEDLHRTALSTSQWKQKRFYHNALYLVRK